jgi:hypothetical protein
MARTRSIKPSFFKNEFLSECDPMARLLYVGLWTLADSQGRMEFRPMRIKAELFPYENCDILGLLKQLADRGFVRAYESGDKRVLEIPTFRDHQRCHPDERDEGLPPADESAETIVFPGENAKPGNFPAPALDFPASCAFNPSSCLPSTSNPLSAPSKPASRSGSKPADPLRWSAENGWEGITDADRAEWSQAYPAADITVELARSTQWLKANPKKAKKSNWRRWLTTVWLCKCQDRGGTHRTVGVRPGDARASPAPDPVFVARAEATLRRERERIEAEHRRLDQAAGDATGVIKPRLKLVSKGGHI